MKGLPILLALLAAACAGGEPRAPAAEVSAQPAPSATVYFLRKYGGAGVDDTLDVGALDLALRMLDEAEGVSLLKSLKSTPTPR